MKKKEVTRAVTARFSLQDYLELQRQAEENGATVADVIRGAWSSSQRHEDFRQLLLALERRQRKNCFEMLCVVVGLDKDERRGALDKLHNMGVKW